jgi:hypothetical protein
MLTAIAVEQFTQLTSLPPRDDDEDSCPSEEEAVKQCYKRLATTITHLVALSRFNSLL